MVALIGFGIAAGAAFLTLTFRLNGSSPPPPGPTPTASALAGAPGIASKTPTSPPVATPTPFPTPTPAPTPTIQCAYETDAAFASAAIDGAFGCPQTPPGQIIWAAWEPFERGAMLWRSDTDQAYVFLPGGRWSAVDGRWSGESQPSRGEASPGFFAPERGFGYIWGASEEIYNALGWATDVEKGFCARAQEFERGFIMQSEDVPSCTVDNLFNHAATAGWQPITLRAHEDGGWR